MIALAGGIPAAWAQSQAVGDERLGTRMAPMLLLTRSDVQADLELTAAQLESARNSVAELHDRALALHGQKDSPEVIAARRAIDEAQADWVASQLSPEQQARLQQIDLQWEGPTALVTRPSVSAALGLDAAQVRELRGAIAALRKQAGSVESPSKLAPAIYERADAILTAAQKDQWRTMLGRPFQVAGRATTTAAEATKSPRVR